MKSINISTELPALYAGTSGLVTKTIKALYPKDFRDKSRLNYYSSLFNSIEINSTFYKLPKASTIQNWNQDVLPGFRFTFKIPKTISHAPNLQYDNREVEKFMDLVSCKDACGCLLIQLPSKTKSDSLPKLKQLLADLKKFNKDVRWHIAIEFRDPSWYNDDVYTILKKNNVAIVNHDYGKQEMLPGFSTANFMYFRFHGPEPRYRGRYSENFLKKVAKDIVEGLDAGKTVYAYFNNTLGDAIGNLEKLNSMLGRCE